MPCMCYYEPGEGTKKYIKSLCVDLVTEVKRLEGIGDPLDCSFQDVIKLLHHLYDPVSCDEKNE